MKLKDKAAVVTGGARGIGRAVSLCFAQEGADVLVADRLGGDAGKVAAEIEGLGRKADSLELDVADKKQVEGMVEKALSLFGRIDLLVNAAGIFVHAPIEEVTEEDWDRVIAVNLKGTFLCCQAAGREMIGQGGGSIVNIASIAAHAPQIGLGAYSPSKAGILLLTKIMAVEWARHGIRVNAVSPGPTATPMFMSIYDSEEKLKRRKKAIPLNRFADPEEIGRAAVYLSSEEARFVTGQSLIIDGGSVDSMYYLMGQLPEGG